MGEVFSVIPGRPAAAAKPDAALVILQDGLDAPQPQALFLGEIKKLSAVVLKGAVGRSKPQVALAVFNDGRNSIEC